MFLIRKLLFKTIVFIFLIVGGMQQSQAMDEPDKDTLPTGYQHFPLRKQIQRYQAVFDPLMKAYPEAFLDVPTPQLFPILKNGFAYLHDYILQDKRAEEEKKPYIDELQVIWSSAQERDRANTLTPRIFHRYMRTLTARASFFKTNTMSSQGLERTKNYVDNVMGRTERIMLIDLTWEWLRHPLFTLCLNPKPGKNRGISSETLVDTYLGHHYGAHVLAFDILLSENIRDTDTFNDKIVEGYLPHYGRFNGTLEMFCHDSGHAERADRDINTNTYALLKKIYLISQEYKKDNLNNSTKLLKDGLDLLFHEVFTYGKKQEGYYSQLDEFMKEPITKEVFSQFIPAISSYMTEDLLKKIPFDSYYYQGSIKDWEVALTKNSHDNGVPFVTQETRSEETVKEGYKSFWMYFKTLVLDKWDETLN